MDRYDPPSSDIWIDWLSRAYEFDSSKADVIRSIVARISMFDAGLALRTIDCILNADPGEFVSSCFFLSHRPEPRTIVRLPAPLREIARIEGTFKGWTMGAGELVILFVCSNSACSFGGRDDVTILGEKWHVKKMDRDRTARMGSSAITAYSSSETAFRLSKIDRVFSNKITEDLLRSYEPQVRAEFGSLEAFRREFRRECLLREFSDCVGMCVFDPRRNNLEFHRSQDMEVANPKQGRYFLKVSTFKTPIKKFASVLTKMDSLCKLYDRETISMYFVSDEKDETLKIVEVVSEDLAIGNPVVLSGLSIPVSVLKISKRVWNDCMRSKKDVPLPADWSWENRRSIR